MSSNPAPVLRARGVDVRYGAQLAVQGADLTLMPGEVVAVTGSSGSGKSSLLHCLAGVLAPAAGSVSFEGREYGALGDEELSALRRERFGYVFQHGELLPELTVEENASLPLRLAGQRKGRHTVRRRLYWNGWGWGSWSGAASPSSPVDRPNESRSQGHWCTSPLSSSPTSPPAHWTR